MEKEQGKYWMVIQWYRIGNEVVSRKNAERSMQKAGYSQVNNPIILRISYVYITYILRIWYVIDSGKTGGLGELGKRLLDN